MAKLGKLTALVVTGALLGFGCTGSVVPIDGSGATTPPGGGPGTRPPGSGPSGPGTSTPPPTGPDAPGQAIFHRLSRTEYNNTVRDLLGDTTKPADKFAADQDSAKSGYYAGGTVAAVDAQNLFDAASTLSQNAMAKLADLLPCKSVPAAAADQDACAKQFITAFGKRAFRRPLTNDETTSLTGFYTQSKAAGDFPNAIRLVISAMLLSPQFIYRWEVDSTKAPVRENGLIRYNSYEMASRLSYLIWASMPDDAAFAAADANKLSTPDQIEAEARRMLKDPKAKIAIADFFTQWLGVTDLKSVAKDTKVYTAFTADLANSMVAETGAFTAAQVIDGDGKLSSVFTSTKSFVDANLAKVYGLAVTSPTPTATDLNAAERGGILTQAAFLTQHASPAESNPVRRGKVIAERVACIDVPSPPDNVPDPKEPAPNLSVRDRFSEHDSNPCAMACHTVFDPIGFAFENYNGIGAYQTQDGGKAVDASGSIKIDDGSKSFKNAIELGTILGASKQVNGCMAKQFLRYALKRHEGAGDEASLSAASAAFTAKQNDLRELIVALTRTRAFTHRTISNGEVLP
jgi:hypothetical protein